MEISKKPMVDILSEMIGEQVVMDGDTYVTLSGEVISSEVVADAERKQAELYDLEVLEQAKAEARQYLLSTDWYVTRFAETGVAVPEDVTAKRAEARQCYDYIPN